MNRFLLFLLFPLWVRAQVNVQSTPLPIMLINTNGQEIPDEPKITAHMGVIDNGPGQVNRPTDPFNGYDGPIGIELRGQTSQQLFPKKGYGLETRDAAGDDANVPLLGLPEESDWVLHGPYSDKSLIRNALAYNLAGRVMEYAPRTRFVELLINGDYLGVYLFTERIKRDKNRVDVAKLDPDENEGDDLTGGYLLRHDKEPERPENGWISPYPPYPGAWQKTWFFYLYPDPDDISGPQKTYIQNWITQLENTLRSPDFADQARGYRQYLDVATFIDYMWVNELAKNIDAYRLSTYMYKDKDSDGGKLKMGPVWDFNIAFGNVNYCTGDSFQGWVLDFNAICPDDYWVIHFWWQRLWEDPRFLEEAKLRWQQLRRNQFSDQAIGMLTDSLLAVIAPAADRNFQRWPVLNEWVWPNNFVGGSYPPEVSYLKNWLRNRLAWMDAAVEGLVTSRPKVADAVGSVVLAPNPAGPEVRFGIRTRLSGAGEIRVFNALGMQVGRYDAGFLQEQMENQVTLEHRLPAGVYHFAAYVEGKLLHSGKMVVK